LQQIIYPMNLPKLVAISGPTGIGKTKLAIELAKKLNAEIISFDSRQIYSELNIGVARPSEEELAEVKHHLIGHKSIHDKYSAQDFVKEVHELIDSCLRRNDEVRIRNYVLVGGTGFFLYALEKGLDELPDISEARRLKVQQEFDRYGLVYMQERVKEIDPVSYSQMEITNPRRLQRIVEIWEETGDIYSDLVSGDSRLRGNDGKKLSQLEIKNIVLDIPREILYDRINQRVDRMIKYGLVEEAKHYLPNRELNALNTVGYKELFSYFDRDLTLEEAIDKIKQHSRNYAKRQITWNKKYLAHALWVNSLQENVVQKILDYVHT
jgi:tRNA dimethylallyltransferase